MTDSTHGETSILTSLVRQLTNIPEKSEENVPELPSAEVYRLLAAERRRYTLEYLATNDESVPLGKLTDQVAAAENNCTIGDVTDEQRKRANVSLVQSHLPRLDDASVINYDSEYRAVQQGPYFEYVWSAYIAVRRKLDTDR